MESGIQRIISYRMSYLLIAILLLLIFILEEVGRIFPALDFVFIFVILATIYVAGTQRKWFAVGVILAVPTIILSLSSNLDNWPPDRMAVISVGFFIVYLGFAILAVVREVLLTDRVTIHTISGALVVFLLLGLLWTFLYILVEGLSPGSFSLPETSSVGPFNPTDLFSNLTYFSLITLTSTGYGDITPVSDLARTLSALEAVVGQVFLAVLIAWLVGKYLVHSLEQK